MPSTHHGLLIHVVFSTKQRFKLLKPIWRNELHSYIGGIASEHRATLLRAGGIEDHIHLLLKIHPSMAIADTVKLLKGNSSKWINAHQMVPAKFEWQRGYGAFSVSESMSETVKRYIENQEEHHRRQTFQDEYLAFLEKHNVKFDPRYVFDDEHVT
ncbi:MAG: IS200/IS605 family transposase [Rhodopirellula sp. JB055]|uniref:IS200/IS605 family transposase n=1 Tax=Rhodopirellula sp. JB055 TaxID=3342846 RepID=UPI00370B9FF0